MSLKHVMSPFSAWVRAFTKPYTVPKARTMRPGAPRYRGWHVNDTDKCVGCGTCASICQNQAIDMVEVDPVETGDSGLRPRVDYGRCCWCALCVDVCPSGSLGMSNEYVWVDDDPDAFRFTPGVDGNPWAASEKGWRQSGDEFSVFDPQRVPMPMLPSEDRVSSWAEVVIGYAEEEARREASRCVQCGICIAACPAHMHIPDYVAAIRDGDYAGAVRIIYDNNPMPEMCGMVCTRKCESVCSVGLQGAPIAIRWLKRFATERFDDLRSVLDTGAGNVGKGHSVAVVGGGPSGFTVAHYLALRGFDVTVYERLPKLGGATYSGIPRYRFPMPSLDKQIALLGGLGVRIVTGHEVGEEEFARLREDNLAIFVGTGRMKPYYLNVHGEHLPGVIYALDLLRDVNLGTNVNVGRRVVVIGGGNVAIDAARVSRRLGAAVTIAYRRRREDMPADDEEIEDAEAEGVEIVTQSIPLEVKATPDGRLNLIWGPAEMLPAEPGKRPRPQLIEGVRNEMVVDRVIVAIGQGPDLTWMGDGPAGAISGERGWVKVDEHGATALESVFAGGDLVNPVADAISAIADGLRAVDGITRLAEARRSGSPHKEGR